MNAASFHSFPAKAGNDKDIFEHALARGRGGGRIFTAILSVVTIGIAATVLLANDHKNLRILAESLGLGDLLVLGSVASSSHPESIHGTEASILWPREGRVKRTAWDFSEERCKQLDASKNLPFSLVF
jgi:hypothetical protein